MSVFGNLTNEGFEEAQDRLGGFQAIPSDAYTGKIKAAYAGKALASNAQNLTIIAELPSGEYRETLWVSNKNGENFFRNKQDATKKIALPGFTIANDICRVTVDKQLSDMITEEKVMNVWDTDAKKELPKSVQMLTELIGKEVTFGILREQVFKQEKNSSGEYVDTNEVRTNNTIDKVFHYPSNMTVVEAENGLTAPDFYSKWVEKNKGVDRDKTKGKSGGDGAPKSGKPGSNTPKPTSSLFGSK